jgi:hypothetical protein
MGLAGRFLTILMLSVGAASSTLAQQCDDRLKALVAGFPVIGTPSGTYDTSTAAIDPSFGYAGAFGTALPVKVSLEQYRIARGYGVPLPIPWRWGKTISRERSKRCGRDGRRSATVIPTSRNGSATSGAPRRLARARPAIARISRVSKEPTTEPPAAGRGRCALSGGHGLHARLSPERGLRSLPCDRRAQG